jgi:hypothetical protein
MKKLLSLFMLSCVVVGCRAQVAGVAGDDTLVVAKNGRTQAVIVVSPNAGGESAPAQLTARRTNVRKWEKEAALDLQKYIELMSGARPRIASTPEAIGAALKTSAPVFLVGAEALKADRTLQAALDRVVKKNPALQADAIVVRRRGNRIFLAGSNDGSHYYAVSWLLQQWGCRWYLPTEFGECVPHHKVLSVGRLEFSYAPPFEVRKYWLSWNGDSSGNDAFQMRNFLNRAVVPCYHTIGAYVKDIVPAGKTQNQLPFSDIGIARHVARQVEEKYAREEYFSLGMEDGLYQSDDAAENIIKAGLQDKYFLQPSMTEPFFTFYNNVAGILRAKYPQSRAKIGFLAYANLTIPPQRAVRAEPSLVAYLAPIDIDPNHDMDDPNSPQRREYREMLYRWSQVMEGRVVIYDYDQGNLVWRDIPDPSQAVFRKDVQHYRRAGVLGLDTESRGAFATTFLNLYFRSQLMWNPDANVDKLFDEFYPDFYGPAAGPMKAYWSAIYDAWKKNIATEHEYFIIPAIYTPSLVARLQRSLAAAQTTLKPLEGKRNPSRNEQLYLQRLKFTELSFEVLSNYVRMLQAVQDVDYAAAVKYGTAGLKARGELTAMNPIFTSTRLESGVAWWPGEVAQYAELNKLVNGEKGKLVVKLPRQWAFRRDPHDTGLVSGWAQKPADLTYWNANKNRVSLQARKDYPDQWEMLDTGLYIQAQGVRFPDAQGFAGYGWYRTAFNLDAAQAQEKLHVKFPGLFNEAWLYVNGCLVAHRVFFGLWWNNDYHFEWDADVSGVLRAGENTITLRINNPHHMGGIFRRPFLYAPLQ